MKRRLAVSFLAFCVLAMLSWPVLAQVLPGTPFGGGAGGGASTSTFSDALFKVCDDGDPTKCVQVQASGITAANTITALSFAGTTALPVILIPPGNNQVAPSLAFTTETNSGIGRNGSSSGVDIYAAGTAIANFTNTANGIKMLSSIGLGWSVSNVTQNVDTGFARHAAGVVKQSNGSATAVAGLFGGGTVVASATALPLPTGSVFHVSGTTDVTSITSTNFASGVCITIIFDGILNFTDGNNLKLATTFATSADDTISLCYDGTNWYEAGRSVN